MHKYLKSIGFSNFEKKSEIDNFFKENLKEGNIVSTYLSDDGRIVGQYNISTCQSAGISVIAEQDKGNIVVVDYYYPYIKGYDYTIIQECVVERHSDKDSYAGIIDDYRLGISLIFYLLNANLYTSLIRTNKISDIKIDKIYLSALSLEGKVILPLDKKLKLDFDFKNRENVNVNYDDDYDLEEDIDDEILENLVEDDKEPVPVSNDFSINKYKEKSFNPLSDLDDEIGMKDISIGIGVKIPNLNNGDTSDAIERYKSEDLYSIVETSLVPYGIECDKYQIVAEILSVNEKVNNFTNEKLYEMRVQTMGLEFPVMINEKDLDGEPLPGRRFRGVIWLLGEIDFTNNKNKKQ